MSAARVPCRGAARAQAARLLLSVAAWGRRRVERGWARGGPSSRQARVLHVYCTRHDARARSWPARAQAGAQAGTAWRRGGIVSPGTRLAPPWPPQAHGAQGGGAERGVPPSPRPPRCRSRRPGRCLQAPPGWQAPSPCRRARCCRQRGGGLQEGPPSALQPSRPAAQRARRSGRDHAHDRRGRGRGHVWLASTAGCCACDPCSALPQNTPSKRPPAAPLRRALLPAPCCPSPPGGQQGVVGGGLEEVAQPLADLVHDCQEGRVPGQWGGVGRAAGGRQQNSAVWARGASNGTQQNAAGGCWPINAARKAAKACRRVCTSQGREGRPNPGAPAGMGRPPMRALRGARPAAQGQRAGRAARRLLPGAGGASAAASPAHPAVVGLTCVPEAATTGLPGCGGARWRGRGPSESAGGPARARDACREIVGGAARGRRQARQARGDAGGARLGSGCDGSACMHCACVHAPVRMRRMRHMRQRGGASQPVHNTCATLYSAALVRVDGGGGPTQVVGAGVGGPRQRRTSSTPAGPRCASSTTSTASPPWHRPKEQDPSAPGWEPTPAWTARRYGRNVCACSMWCQWEHVGQERRICRLGRVNAIGLPRSLECLVWDPNLKQATLPVAPAATASSSVAAVALSIAAA